MKFIHLGDLHIGKNVNDFNMIDDQKFILNQILDIIDENNIEAALLAGDIYDKPIPSEDAVSLLNSFINELVKRNVKTFIISGNHDSDERLNFGSSLFEKSDVFIFTKYEGKLLKQSLKDEFGNINIYMMPFIKASQVKHYYEDEEILSYDDAVRVVLEHTEINKSERNIIIAHQFVAGKSGNPQCGGSESIATQTVGAVEIVYTNRFDDFDYVALGHIHSPQKLEKETIRYSGSLLKYSLSEVDKIKSVPIITLGEKGKVDIDLIELKPQRDMRHIKGKLNQLLSPENIVSPEDFMWVTLTDDIIEPNAYNIFRAYYPNIMKLDYNNSHTVEADQQVEIIPLSQNKSFEEIISDFYKLKYGVEIPEEELQIMQEIAREAGVGNETY
ncbi:MAG: exonuclease SbcCD subunit D [Candidatus Riflebacteria bacterium]|nr:exonuclease SbcCD subunit D [Candidatus Riflebacteria bacterium]